uniref:Response regulator receiver protein n=1 Tax=Sphingobacterium sp. (strain 21) TaxID=743722 RepID=F4C9S2_SPHS2
MFKKILIAEDHDTENFAVQVTLRDLGVVDPDYVYYCDHALAWIKNAIRAGEPYNLLITDINFKDDGSAQEIKDGLSLIKAIKSVQPDIKVVVMTVQEITPAVHEMLKAKQIDGYVLKARRGREHLKEALRMVYQGRIYQSADNKKSIPKNSFEFSPLDLQIVNLLYQGIPQYRMPEILKQIGAKASSLSTIEKRLNLMKESLGFTNNGQLIAHCRDAELI